MTIKKSMRTGLILLLPLLGAFSVAVAGDCGNLSDTARAEQILSTGDVACNGAKAEESTKAVEEHEPKEKLEIAKHVRGPALRSSSALIIDQKTGQVLYSKNADNVMSIASITKLMTAMVVLDKHLPLDEKITISKEDMDHLKNTSSRLRVGVTLTRRQLLQLALMSSENRAAAALARTYPGGLPAFVMAMNHKAAMLGMKDSHFVDSTGLNSANQSTAEDLAKMVNAAYKYDLICKITTTAAYDLPVHKRARALAYRNTNSLVKNKSWKIGLSKTGYINEAGHCLVMQAKIASQPMIIVLLDSWGKYTRLGDANRIKKWLESSLVRNHMG
jgi:D-alanyl-D-alanine endopeptidase (penicillin-binding protein 7)